MGVMLSFAPLFPRTPRILVSMLFSRQNRNLVLMQFTTQEYGSLRFTDISSAILLWNLSASGPMPPKVETTIGVKVPFSTWIMRSLQVAFFSLSCCLYTRVSPPHLFGGGQHQNLLAPSYKNLGGPLFGGTSTDGGTFKFLEYSGGCTTDSPQNNF